MNYYYDIQVKQLISPKGDWEVVYSPGEEGEFCDDVVYFAVCDLKAQPIRDENPPDQDDDCIGIILPVLFDKEEGLVPQLLSYWKEPKEQRVVLRPKEK